MNTEGPTQRSRPLRVFLSHTSVTRQFPAERSFVAAAEAAVNRAGHAVIGRAYFSSRDLGPADYSRAVVASADVFVGIVGNRYGTAVRDRPELSYTELEFEAATRLRLPRLVFLIDEDSGYLPPSRQRPEEAARQEAFRLRLMNAGVTIASVSSPADLEISLFHALVESSTVTDHPRSAPMRRSRARAIAWRQAGIAPLDLQVRLAGLSAPRWWQAFTDGVGAVFDVFGVTRARPRTELPTFASVFAEHTRRRSLGQRLDQRDQGER